MQNRGRWIGDLLLSIGAATIVGLVIGPLIEPLSTEEKVAVLAIGVLLMTMPNLGRLIGTLLLSIGAALVGLVGWPLFEQLPTEAQVAVFAIGGLLNILKWLLRKRQRGAA